MLLSVWLVALLALGYTWVQANPQAVCALVAKLKRQWRLWLIQKKGERAAERIGRQLRVWAAKRGIAKELVKQVWTEQREEVVRRLGSQIATRLLGEPTSLERYF